MKQQSFTDVEYSNRRRTTRRDHFLNTMDRIVPWEELCDLIRPYYPSGKRGRPPRGIETMLRMYLLQQWFSLSAEGIEDVIYDSYAMRSFMNVDFIGAQAPAATTLSRFRRLLKKHDLEIVIQERIEQCLTEKGLTLNPGTIIYAYLGSEK